MYARWNCRCGFSHRAVCHSPSSSVPSLNTRVVHYPAFPGHPKLCVVRCLRAYEMMTEEYRPPGISQLFISLQPFKAVTAATIACWVRWVLQEAGVNTSAFGAHSTRGAMASKAFALGGRLEDILRAAGWSSDSTFKTFYFKPILGMASIVVDQL